MPAAVLSCVNLKGGVGKTALAVNFAAYCGSLGKRTLLIDLDPQTNATFSCINVEEWEQHAASNGTVADLLGVRQHTSAEGAVRSVQTVIRRGVFPDVDLIPSHLDLFTVDLDLAGETARETKLRRAIRPIIDEYDLIVCDCPPNLTIPTQNALVISTHFAVPISPDFLSGIGVGLLLNRVQRFASELEISLDLAGIVLSRVGRPAQHRDEMTAAIRQRFGNRVLDREIKERVVVSESATRHVPIFNSGDADAADEFRTVSGEILRRMGVPT
jgi:chromosome partitioning protein